MTALTAPDREESAAQRGERRAEIHLFQFRSHTEMSQGTPQGNKTLRRKTVESGEGGSNTGKEREAQL